LGYFQGFCGQIERYLGELFSPRNILFRPRPEMERDPSFKQLIPYLIFRHCDAGGRQWVFQYTRGTGQGEGRLHSKRSVGIGGHISEEDHGLFSSDRGGYQEGMRRELMEEAGIDAGNGPAVAAINDDSTEVGCVHFGVVHVVRVSGENVAGGRSGIVGPEFIPMADAVKDPSGYESWSRFCLEHLDLLLSKAGSSDAPFPGGRRAGV